jgi:two-component system NarL family sensor kinase
LSRVTAIAPGREPEAAAEAERTIAWLRLALIPLIAGAQSLPHPNPEDTAFYVAVGVVTAYGIAALAWTYTRPVTPRFMLGATVLDVAAITALVALSGGAFSQARLAYFLVPVAVAFRFTPALTAAASGATVAAYVTQSLLHPARHQSGAGRFIVVQVGFLAWLGLAAVLLSALLERRTTRLSELAAARRRLITDALTAEERERRSLAEGLHDHAIQNLLSARHDLAEAGGASPHVALERADDALAKTIGELREAVFELHPYVLEQAGLPTALRALAQRAARHGDFRVELDLRYERRNPHESLLLIAAREALANATQHARATKVSVSLAASENEVRLEIRDDGDGFDLRDLPKRIAEGHIGLQSQRERIESVRGTVDIDSAPGRGTTVSIRVPA